MLAAVRAHTPAEPAKSLPTSKQGYHRRFDDAQKWVKIFDDPARDRWQKPEAVIPALNIHNNDRVADIGAGTGYFSLRIARAFPSVTVYAADVEPDMIDYMKKQTKKELLPNHKPLKVKPNEIHFPRKVNLILVVDTYHHIDDRVKYFSALKKQLRRNGKIAIIDFTAESPEGPPLEHRISKEKLVAEMNTAGFAVSEDISLLPNQYFLIFQTKP
ncbi:MAG: methyltransferase domain-containing protein [Candidatus Melainabacteria bacterium]|nr:MAG: methyltransferase domain-containing protein [Candidatus Melainabacteria bacterium]